MRAVRRWMSTFRPRRSVLYLPGSNQKAIEKSRTLNADSIIFDLEDAVAPNKKAEARELVSSALGAGGFGYRETIIRINSPGTEWEEEDMRAAVAARPDAILLPKVNTASDILRAQDFLNRFGAPSSISLWAMMETPKAVLNALSIASTSSETRLACMVMGTNDLSKETRARIVPGRFPMNSWLMTCVAAARSAKLDIIDGVFNDISDSRGFEQECLEGSDRGFDGKTVIHPSQIDLANIAFKPTPAEVVWARKILDAFSKPENSSQGVILLEGRMVERLHAVMAERTVAIADAISSRE